MVQKSGEGGEGRLSYFDRTFVREFAAQRGGENVAEKTSSTPTERKGEMVEERGTLTTLTVDPRKKKVPLARKKGSLQRRKRGKGHATTRPPKAARPEEKKRDGFDQKQTTTRLRLQTWNEKQKRKMFRENGLSSSRESIKKTTTKGKEDLPSEIWGNREAS